MRSSSLMSLNIARNTAQNIAQNIALITTLIIAPMFVRSTAYGSTLETFENELLNTPALQALEANVLAQKATTESLKGSFLPSLSIHGGFGDENTFADQHEGSLGYLTGSWNLYRGGADLFAKKISERHQEVARLERDMKVRALRRQLREIYYSILSNKKALSLLEEKAQFLHQQRKMAQKKISAGLTSSVDGIEIDLEENSITAERESLQAELQRFTLDLTSLVNSKIEAEQISSAEGFDSALTDVNMHINVEEALAKNPTLLKQAQMEEAVLLKSSVVRAEFLPRLNIEASYGRLTPQYSDPLQGTESKVFLLLSWNLFSGMSNYHQKEAARFEEKSQRLERTSTYIELKRQLENMLTTKSSIAKLQGLHKQRLTFATKYYEMTLSEYKRGIKNSADLETATTSLFESKRKIIELERDLSILNAQIQEII